MERQDALNTILEAIGLRVDDCGGDVTITGAAPYVASNHRLGELMVSAITATGIGAAALWREKTNEGQDITTDVSQAIHQHHGIAFLRQNGVYLSNQTMDSILGSPFYTTADGRHVKTCTPPYYPSIVEALIKTLNCRSDQNSIQREIAKWKGEELEEAVQTNGGAIGLVRTYEEWVKHPIGSALAKQPIVQIIKIGESDPIPLPKEGDQPLSGIRVLDNSHVVGGPWANSKGFDPIAVAVSGFCADEGSIDAPIMPVTDIYADYLAGYVAASAVTAALLRRSREGGSYEIRISLTRLSMWAREIGLIDSNALSGDLPFFDNIDIPNLSNMNLQTNRGPFGELTYLPTQIKMSKTQPYYIKNC